MAFKMQKEPFKPIRMTLKRIEAPDLSNKYTVENLIQALQKYPLNASVSFFDFDMCVEWEELESDEDFQKRLSQYNLDYEKWKNWCERNKEKINALNSLNEKKQLEQKNKDIVNIKEKIQELSKRLEQLED